MVARLLRSLFPLLAGILLIPLPASAQQSSTQRGRPINNGVTFVADNGRLLRGPFASTEWGNPPPQANIAAIKELGCNAVHLYGEVFSPTYPVSGNVPGYAAARIDQMVQMTRDLGLYLVITIGNGAANGSFNHQYVLDFWNFYAPRYKNETHVLYEIQNEPHAWSAPYPQAALDMQRDAYTLIRSHAPDTPILLFSFAVLGNGANALADIRSVSTAANIDWTRAAVGFHGYAGHADTGPALEAILAAGFPCFMTEFTSDPWGMSDFGAQDVEMTAILERLGISWLSFLHIPPNFINSAVTHPLAHRGVIDRAGLSWVPDYGTWPRPRGPFGNNGLHRATTGLTGTLRIQAEDFDTGGQDIAYFDTDTANTGGAYRATESVDIQTTNDTGGGHHLTDLAAGEWLEYSIRVTEPGLHTLRLRVAGFSTEGRSLRILCNDTDVTGEWTLPATGGTASWSTVNREVWLDFGLQKLRVEVLQPGFNLNWIELAPVTTPPVANGAYRFLNRHSGLALSTQAGSNASDTLTVQAPYTGAADQLWTLTHQGAGQYRVSAFNNSRHLYIFNSEQARIVPWWGGGINQRFLLRPVGNGFHRLVHVDTGRSLEVTGASPDSGAIIRRHAFTGAGHQQWAVLAGASLAFPTRLSATPLPAGGATLSWTGVTGASSYSVKRSTTSGGPYSVIADNVTSTSFTDTTGAAGLVYHYVVSARHSGGESLDSSEAFATPLHLLLRFDETSGATATDATGQGRNGTLVNGPTWTTGYSGNAVRLDGVNDHVTLPTGVVAGLQRATIATWIYLDTVSTWSRVFDFGSGTNNYLFLTPRHSGGSVRFAIRTSSTSEQTITGTAPLPSGAWTHVAVTLGDGVGILYVNGTEVGRNSSMTLTPASLGNTTQNRLGRSQFSADPYIAGRLDDFRIYPGVLAPASIHALAFPPPPPPAAPSGLIATPGPANATLTWIAPANATSYNLKRSDTPATGFTLLATGLTSTTYLDNSLRAGQTVYYRVSALTDSSEGPDSNEASVSTQPSDAHLRFDEGTGTTATDATARGWDATLVNGAGWGAGRLGQALQLDGLDDHATLPAGVVSGLNDFTLALWINLGAHGNWARVFDFGTGTNNYMFLTPRTGTSGNARFAIRTPTVGEQIISGNAPLPVGVWTHVAITRSGTTGTLYVNGVAVGTSNTILLSPADLGRTTLNYLGRSQWSGDSYLAARIDEFRLRPLALSAAEIAALASVPPAPAGLIADAGDRSVALAWNTVPSAVHYTLKRATTPGGPHVVLADLVSTTSYTDTTVTNGLTYYYVITARNAAGESLPSAERFATPRPPIAELERRAPALSLEDGRAVLTIMESVAGRTYQVQFTTDLTGEWTNLGPPRIGDGTALRFDFPHDPALPRQFYRVVLIP